MAKKDPLYRVFLEAPDGKTNRTMEMRAPSADKARRAAERSADDVAEQYGTEAFEVKKVEQLKTG